MATDEGRWPPPPGGTWAIDLDGVVWLSGSAIRGAREAVAELRDAGVRTLFVTNNSSPTTEELLARLERVGIEAGPTDVVSSAQAAASLLRPGSSALVVADAGVAEALTARGVEVVDGGPADAVVVGWTRSFDFDALDRAQAAVRRGAVLVGTNEDPTHPTPEGLKPGGGSLVAAVAVASGATPVIAGKPHPAMVELVRRRAGDVVAVVGDRPTTDGRLADRLGVPFGLVLTGVTAPGAVDDGVAAGAVAKDLASLVAGVRGATREA